MNTNFEEKVRQILRRHGFKVTRLKLKDTRPDIGEIDAVAYNRDVKILLVVDAKSPKANLSLEELRKGMYKSEKWYEKLFKKVDWVQENVEFVLRKLEVCNCEVKCFGEFIVTSFPVYVRQELTPFIVTLEEFELNIEKH